MAERPDRRTFLSASVAASATLMLLRGDSDHPVRMSWCNRPVHPLAAKRCAIARGAISPMEPVLLRLMIDGPEFGEPLCVHHATVELHAEIVDWPLRLSHNHPQLVPGDYHYWVELKSATEYFESPRITYQLNPFRFGV